MKNFLLLLLIFPLLTSCIKKSAPEKLRIDGSEARENFGKEIIISPMDNVTIGSHLVTISPQDENTTYTISGYFDGQIVTSTKNTVIKLHNAYLENTSGKPALRCKAKTEVSSTNGTTNYIVSRGRGWAKNAALLSLGGLILGGSGTLYVNGKICHGIEAENVKIKGTGTLYVQGTKRGSALCCDNFTVEADKSFSAYFLNAKNGIKADETMNIASGNFYLYNNEIALKTDLNMEAPDRNHGITITGGKFHTYKNTILFITEQGAYNNIGATFAEESDI